jgi:NADPH2:quinone reductase
MNKIIEIQTNGDSDVLKVSDVNLLSAGKDQASIKITLAGVNFIDVYHRRGQYALPLPSRLGLEGIGEIIEIESETSDFKVGDIVFWTSTLGSYAQYIAVPVNQLTRIDSNITLKPDQILPLLLQGMTAHYLANSAYLVNEGDTVLVTAAAGGVGQILVQLLKAKSVRIIALASTIERANYAKSIGADFVGTYQDIAELVSEATNGAGVNVVYDSVGKDVFDSCLDTLTWKGMYVLYGAASGPVPPFDLMRLNPKSLSIRRPSLGAYTQNYAERVARFIELAELAQTGKLKYPAAKVLPLTQAKQAHDLIESRTYSGKIALDPWF